MKCANHCKCQDCKNLEDSPGGSDHRGGAWGGAALINSKGTPGAATTALEAVASLARSGSDAQSWDVMPPPLLGTMAAARSDCKRLKDASGGFELPTSLCEPTVAYGSARGPAALVSPPDRNCRTQTPRTVSSKPAMGPAPLFLQQQQQRDRAAVNGEPPGDVAPDCGSAFQPESTGMQLAMQVRLWC